MAFLNELIKFFPGLDSVTLCIQSGLSCFPNVKASLQEPSANEENEEEKMKRVKEKFEKDMWEESFKSHRDSKPKGPASVGMDIAFPGFEYIYGIPEHTDSFNLANTKWEKYFSCIEVQIHDFGWNFDYLKLRKVRNVKRLY